MWRACISPNKLQPWVSDFGERFHMRSDWQMFADKTQTVSEVSVAQALLEALHTHNQTSRNIVKLRFVSLPMTYASSGEKLIFQDIIAEDLNDNKKVKKLVMQCCLVVSGVDVLRFFVALRRHLDLAWPDPTNSPADRGTFTTPRYIYRQYNWPDRRRGFPIRWIELLYLKPNCPRSHYRCSFFEYCFRPDVAIKPVVSHWHYNRQT